MFCEETIFGQPSWVLESDRVRLAVTWSGAHLGPAMFFRDETTPVQPYHVSPWQGEKHGLPEGASEAVLRGDFFCLPFGKAAPQLEMNSHGRTAGSRWSLAGVESGKGLQTFRIIMEDALQGATVTRQFVLREGENVIYDLTSIAGLEGAYTLGHHAVLRTPQREEALLVSTSRQLLGMPYPGPFACPEQGERQALAMGAEFESLDQVPSMLEDAAAIDCSVYPARRGFCDLLQVAVKPEPGQPAWSAAVNTQEGYLWFSLRNAAQLPSTLLWIENCGRRSSPWNGRNCSLGVEDVCSYFDWGSEEACAPNPFSLRGIRTVQRFERTETLHVPYLQGVVRVPPGFNHVRSVSCDAFSASFVDRNGVTVKTAVQTGFALGEPITGN